MPDREKVFNLYKLAIAAIGGVILAFAGASIKTEIFDWRFALYLVFTVLIASRMSLTLPRSKVLLSFSDSMIFLTFLVFGGETAIVIASLEMFSTCLFARRGERIFSRFAISFNVGAAIISTALSFGIWILFSDFLQLKPDFSNTASLISTLGILALSQFLAISTSSSIFYALKTGSSALKYWKDEFYSISLTHFIGAGLAGVVYKLFTLGDTVTLSVCLAIFFIAYLTFSRSLRETAASLRKAELAEREKAAQEKLRLEQAEKHAEELSEQLFIEEGLNFDLEQSKIALEYAAIHDVVTDLYNRPYFIERLQSLFDVDVHKTCRYFVVFLDLHRFKNINDSLGYNIGDKVLKLVALRLQRITRDEDTLARIGGDEYAIIFNDLSSVEEAEQYARRIHEKLSAPFAIQGNRIFTKPHIGVAPLDETYDSPEGILRDVDIAMHYAKAEEVGVTVFNTEIRDRFLERVRLESDLRFAVERREFLMYYQPLISLSDGALIGFEALLRWKHPRRGLVSPAEFIPIAEDSGLIIPMTEWILQETTEQLAEWQKISPAHGNLIMSVNISGKHLAHDKLIRTVKKAVADSGIKPVCLKLEITESVAMEDAERTIVILKKLKKIGVQLSIDDFGTGYSSLNYLHRLPFDFLKIDRSFVGVVGDNGENSEILQTIIHLAKNLKMRTIAEGIETERQMQILQDLDCDFAQGYLFSKPLPKDEIENQLYQHRNWFPASFSPQDLEIADAVEDPAVGERLSVF